jgi:chromosome segregation ATPase
MANRSLRISVLALAFAACFGPAGGCASDPGRTRSAGAVEGLQETRTELAATRKQVDEAIAAAAAVQSAQGDLKPAYEKYRKEVAETESRAQNVRKRAADMQERGKEYREKWRSEMSKVDSPELKAAADARAAKLEQRYAGITAKAQAVRTAYEPFMKGLKDLQTYLSNDLTPAAVQAGRPAFDKVRTNGNTLNQKLDALAKELDEVAATMSPGGGTAQ